MKQSKRVHNILPALVFIGAGLLLIISLIFPVDGSKYVTRIYSSSKEIMKCNSNNNSPGL